ncbi:hypothetical protein [Gottschalkia acidurici]|uniref:hypothetical protein n=1 Tax=Clostridium acidurici TaxID=1556 RepID=UPI00031F94A1|nr:hypothetical protein [Gottschalkia acidurici]
MIIDSNIKVAVTCHKCGRINVEQLNLFNLNRDEKVKLSCSCGSLNAIINSRNLKNIYLRINCVDCGEEHFYKYKVKNFIKGTEILCMENGMGIAIIGNTKDISRYIKDAEKNTLEALNDEKFQYFFTDHYIMKQSLERLQWLRENGRVNCDCGNEDIIIEVYFDRIELRCTRCHSTKVIYAESQEDLNNFYCKNKINMHKYEFEFIDAIKNSDNNK